MKNLMICLSGPESTGKTTLARQIAEQLSIRWIPEYAREWLGQYGPDCKESDLLAIAKGQWRQERQALTANAPLVLDTDLLNIRLWSELRYGRCHSWILERSEQTDGKMYLLMADDIPWVPDPYREDPTRAGLLEAWHKLLGAMGVHYKLVTGQGESRFLTALRYSKEYLKIEACSKKQ